MNGRGVGTAQMRAQVGSRTPKRMPRGVCGRSRKELQLREESSVAMPSRAWALAAAALAALIALTALVAAPEAEAKSKKSVKVKVMTRNIFLGADLSPAPRTLTALSSSSRPNGAILREVDQTNFPLRAQGLAARSKQKKPDLIGLQEVACGAPARPVDPARRPRRDTHYGHRGQVRLPPDPARRAEGERAELQGRRSSRRSSTSKRPPTRRRPDARGVASAARSQRSADDARRDPRQQGLEGEREAQEPGRPAPTRTCSRRSSPESPVPVTRGWTAGDVTVTKGKGKQAR